MDCPPIHTDSEKLAHWLVNHPASAGTLYQSAQSTTSGRGKFMKQYTFFSITVKTAVVHTVLPMWFHLMNFPEILVQSGLLAWLTHFWVNHPEKKWLTWLLWIFFGLVILMSALGALSAFGVLPSAD
jgi:hypothetical protein